MPGDGLSHPRTCIGNVRFPDGPGTTCTTYMSVQEVASSSGDNLMLVNYQATNIRLRKRLCVVVLVYCTQEKINYSTEQIQNIKIILNNIKQVPT
jgi:hypothetical protein